MNITAPQIICALSAFMFLFCVVFTNATGGWNKLLFKVVPAVLAFLLGLVAFGVIK